MVRGVMAFMVVWALASLVIYWLRYESKKKDRRYALRVLMFGLFTAILSVGLVAFIVALF